MNNKAIVVLSGGADSTICLYAIKRALGDEGQIFALTFDYGQRHAIEIESAVKIARMAGVDSHEIVAIGNHVLHSTSPLVADTELEQYKDSHSLPGGLEKTFVPMRNQLFLTIAANRAYERRAGIIVTGVCQEDSGGYPDCRRAFVDSLQSATNQGSFADYPNDFKKHFGIMTPLMYMTKAESVEFALTIPGCYGALAYSHTAYDGAYPPIGHDHATLLRAKGFEEAGVPDPLVLRAVLEGVMPMPATPNYSADLVTKYRAIMFEDWGVSDALFN